jgi:hypothetical protein
MDGLTAGSVTAIIGVLIYYVKTTIKHQVERENKHDDERIEREGKRDKEQKEERDYYRNLIDGGMRKNAALNVKGITLTKVMIKDFKSHNGQAKEFSEKMIKTLNEICNRAFGERRKGNKKVKVDRRK